MTKEVGNIDSPTAQSVMTLSNMIIHINDWYLNRQEIIIIIKNSRMLQDIREKLFFEEKIKLTTGVTVYGHGH